MSTRKDTVALILQKLGSSDHYSARPMFGEYALYAADKVVALICDDRLYVKIVPASNELEEACERGEPYSRAKPHYIIDEGQLSTIDTLPAILFAIADGLPTKKKKAPRK